MKRKAITIGLSVFLSLSVILTGCGKKDKTATETTVETQEYKAGAAANSASAKALAENVNYRDIEDTDSKCVIELNGSDATISSDGAELKDGVLSITAAGTYELSGNFTGKIQIDAGDDDKVYIILNGINISSDNYSPFVVNNADKVIIYLNENTTNTFTDCENYELPDGMAEEDLPTAVIYSECDLGFSGTGKLVVNAKNNDGIASKKDIWFNSGEFEITSADDGIVGKKSIAVKTGSFNINSQGDGIKTTEAEDVEKGFVAIEGGTFTIVSGNDGIQAETYLYVKDGEFNITTAGESESDSFKAVKAGNDITILGGEWNIDSVDDAFNSNSTLSINAGTINISSGNDGFHADEIIVLSDGNITISKSYEGIESNVIVIEGGNIDVTASDDGLNATNGMNAGSMDPNDTSNSTSALYITGGTMKVNADGDGLDSNGFISMSGGDVTVYGPENSGNGFFDYDTTFNITGGQIVAAGSSGMLQSASDSSSQCSLAVVLDSSCGAGTEVTLKDSSGNVVAGITPNKTFNAVMFSNSNLKQGDSYDVFVNGESSKTITLSSVSVIDGYEGMGGGMRGGGMKGGNMPDGERPQMSNGERPDVNMQNGKMNRNGERPQMPNGETTQKQNSEVTQ